MQVATQPGPLRTMCALATAQCTILSTLARVMSDVLRCCATLSFGHNGGRGRVEMVLWDHGDPENVQAGGEGTRDGTKNVREIGTVAPRCT